MYIYSMKDPRQPEGKNIVFVGTSLHPWIAIRRHLLRSSNPEIMEWAKGLLKSFPEGIEILGPVVLERWHGEHIPLPESSLQGGVRLEWEVLGEIDPWIPNTIVGKTLLKTYWIEKLREGGHPLLNKKVGRPKKEN